MTNINRLISENIGKPICINLDPDDVSVAGQKEISRYLRRHDLYCPEYTFDWRVRSERGTLGKRISSENYKEAGIKLSSTNIEDINNIANKHRAYFDTFYIKFDKGLFWDIGQFNDGDSCYWRSKSFMRAKLNGSRRVYAVKLYRDMMFDEVFGRALIIMECPDKESVICINSYPKGFQVTNIGRLLVKFASMNETRVMTKYLNVTYRSSWKDYIWINGGNGAIVTPYQENKVIPEHIDIFNHNVIFEKCSMCGYKTTSLVSVGDQIGCVCSHCRHKIKDCDYCEQAYRVSEMEKVGTKYICKNCSFNLVKCAMCNKKYLPIRPGATLHVCWIHEVMTFPENVCAYVPFIGFVCASCSYEYYKQSMKVERPFGYTIKMIYDSGTILAYPYSKSSQHSAILRRVVRKVSDIEKVMSNENEPKTQTD